MSTGLLVAIIVGGLLLLLGTILVAVLRFVRRRARRVDARIAEDLAAGPAIRGPQRANYFGGTGSYPTSSGNGKLTLTGTHVTFRIMIGTDVVVPLEEIVEVREELAFPRIVRPRRPHLEIVTAEGKVAIFVRDSAGWVDAVRAQLPAGRSRER